MRARRSPEGRQVSRERAKGAPIKIALISVAAKTGARQTLLWSGAGKSAAFGLCFDFSACVFIARALFNKFKAARFELALKLNLSLLTSRSGLRRS